jgi:hypothetical protein
MKSISNVRLLLHLEGAILFAAAVAAFIHLQGSVWLFLALILVPDLSMLGYLHNPKTGAFIYDAAHTTLSPALLLLIGLAGAIPTLVLVALIWLAHIGMDRAVGYGLKYPTHFKDTHLQRV